MAVLEAYLPAQMDEEAVSAIVAEVIAAEGATGPGDLGRVMKAAMPRIGGQGRRERRESDRATPAGGRPMSTMPPMPPGAGGRPRGGPPEAPASAVGGGTHTPSDAMTRYDADKDAYHCSYGIPSPALAVLDPERELIVRVDRPTSASWGSRSPTSPSGTRSTGTRRATSRLTCPRSGRWSRPTRAGPRRLVGGGRAGARAGVGLGLPAAAARRARRAAACGWCGRVDDRRHHARALRVLETSHPPTFYLPREDVPTAAGPGPGGSFCEWKGRRPTSTSSPAGHRRARAAWYYPDARRRASPRSPATSRSTRGGWTPAGRRRAGAAPGRRFLRRLDHRRDRRAVQGGRRHPGLVRPAAPRSEAHDPGRAASTGTMTTRRTGRHRWRARAPGRDDQDEPARPDARRTICPRTSATRRAPKVTAAGREPARRTTSVPSAAVDRRGARTPPGGGRPADGRGEPAGPGARTGGRRRARRAGARRRRPAAARRPGQRRAAATCGRGPIGLVRGSRLRQRRWRPGARGPAPASGARR